MQLSVAFLNTRLNVHQAEPVLWLCCTCRPAALQYSPIPVLAEPGVGPPASLLLRCVAQVWGHLLQPMANSLALPCPRAYLPALA